MREKVEKLLPHRELRLDLKEMCVSWIIKLEPVGGGWDGGCG